MSRRKHRRLAAAARKRALIGPATRCEGCAFTPGTAANLQSLTLLKATLCVRAAEPFLCHAPLVDGVLTERRLCVGYVDAVGVLRERGFYANRDGVDFDAAADALRVVIALEDRLLDGEPITLRDVPRQVLALVSGGPR